MFPKTLDGAEVIYYTEKNNFGSRYYTTGEIYDQVCYLAICKYPNTSNEFYLFECNDSFEVISDTLEETILACVKSASDIFGNDVSWIEFR